MSVSRKTSVQMRARAASVSVRGPRTKACPGGEGDRRRRPRRPCRPPRHSGGAGVPRRPARRRRGRCRARERRPRAQRSRRPAAEFRAAPGVRLPRAHRPGDVPRRVAWARSGPAGPFASRLRWGQGQEPREYPAIITTGTAQSNSQITLDVRRAISKPDSGRKQVPMPGRRGEGGEPDMCGRRPHNGKLIHKLGPGAALGRAQRRSPLARTGRPLAPRPAALRATAIRPGLRSTRADSTSFFPADAIRLGYGRPIDWDLFAHGGTWIYVGPPRCTFDTMVVEPYVSVFAEALRESLAQT